MNILYRDEDKAYRGDMLWLPKKHVNAYAIKSMCTAIRQDGSFIEAFWETERHLVVPREFPLPEVNTFPVIDMAPQTWEHVNWHCLAEDRSPADVATWSAFRDEEKGILHLGCGKGKTVMALRKIAKEQGPALVVVHTSQLAGQWLERAVSFLQIDGLGAMPGDHIGLVRGKTQQWDRPLVIAMIQTMVKRQVPVDVRRRFKVVVYDECHHLAAETWMGSAHFGFGQRLGLTATPETEIGSHRLYYMHLGPILHRDLEQPLIPKCYFVPTYSTIDMKDPKIRDCTGQLSVGKMFGVLGRLEQRNQHILAEIEKALGSGRKILALSGSEEHCWTLHNMMPDSGICVGDVPLQQRLDYLAEKKIIFATMPLAKEGLDQPDLDTVMCLTPFKKKNALQQIVGRVQREGGKEPLAIFFEDRTIPPCAAMCRHIYRHLASWGFPIIRVSKEVQ